MVTSDSQDRPSVGAVVAVPSTSRAHHDCRMAFRVRDDPYKRMRVTAVRQSRVSQATTVEPLVETLLDSWEQDLSGQGRTVSVPRSHAPEVQVGHNTTHIDSDEESLVRSSVFAATHHDASVVSAESDTSQFVHIQSSGRGRLVSGENMGAQSSQGAGCTDDNTHDILRSNRFAVLGSGEPGGELEGPRTITNRVHTVQNCPVVNMAADSEDLSDTVSGAGQVGEQDSSRRSLIWDQEWHRDVRVAERLVRDWRPELDHRLKVHPSLQQSADRDGLL